MVAAHRRDVLSQSVSLSPWCNASAKDLIAWKEMEGGEDTVYHRKRPMTDRVVLRDTINATLMRSMTC